MHENRLPARTWPGSILIKICRPGPGSGSSLGTGFPGPSCKCRPLLGITKYLLEFTREYLQQKVNNKAVKEMDHRLCAIPRYPGLIVLKNGLENISKFTANDYRNIMKVIIFVIDNLYYNNYNKDGGISCNRLCKIFCNYLKMYMKLRQETFTNADLIELEVSMIDFL